MIDDFKDFIREMWKKFLLLFVVFVIAGLGLGIYTGETLEPKTRTVSTIVQRKNSLNYATLENKFASRRRDKNSVSGA